MPAALESSGFGVLNITMLEAYKVRILDARK